MAWTKKAIIAEAFTELGKGSYTFDSQPEEYQTALRRLDAMMATWGDTANIRINYVGGNGFGDIGVESTVPDWAVAAMYLNLAINLAPSYGKVASPETKINAKAAFDAVMNETTERRTRYIGGYAGAGRLPYTRLPEAPTFTETGGGGYVAVDP